MSKADHTPGPWHIGVSGLNQIIHGAHNDKNVAPLICEVFHLYNTRMPDADEHKAQCVANARLIAAAPELLEALEHARALIVLHNQNCKSSADYIGQNDIHFYDAAIAKAKGDAA